MANIKEENKEFAACLCMIIGAICLLVGFLYFLGLGMAVMTISFALALHLFKALWVAKNGKLKKISIRKLLN